MGRFTLSEHRLSENSDVNHLDLFLYVPDKDYLITYKLPKNKIDTYGFLQSNHRLRYLYYDGKIKNNEQIHIIKKGFFIGQRQLSSPIPPGFLKISLEQGNGNLANMWKKTDFKIAFDEIKLYEIADDKRSLWEKQIAEREQALSEKESQLNKPGHVTTQPSVVAPATTGEFNEKNIPQNGIIESEVIAMINPPPKIPEPGTTATHIESEIKTGAAIETGVPDQSDTVISERPSAIADIPAEKISSGEIPKGVAAAHTTPPEEFIEDKNQEFVPIQELILDDKGKAAEQYSSNQ